MKISWFGHNKYEWHKKFMWLPFVFRDEKDRVLLVWLEYVKRKKFYNKYIYSCKYNNRYYEKIKNFKSTQRE